MEKPQRKCSARWTWAAAWSGRADEPERAPDQTRAGPSRSEPNRLEASGLDYAKRRPAASLFPAPVAKPTRNHFGPICIPLGARRIGQLSGSRRSRAGRSAGDLCGRRCRMASAPRRPASGHLMIAARGLAGRRRGPDVQRLEPGGQHLADFKTAPTSEQLASSCPAAKPARQGPASERANNRSIAQPD